MTGKCIPRNSQRNSGVLNEINDFLVTILLQEATLLFVIRVVFCTSFVIRKLDLLFKKLIFKYLQFWVGGIRTVRVINTFCYCSNMTTRSQKLIAREYVAGLCGLSYMVAFILILARLWKCSLI